MVKSVLVPLDGSTMAEQVLPYAEALVKQSQGQLFLLTAIPDIATSGEYIGQRDIAKEMEEAEAYLDGKAKPLAAAGIKIAAEARVGIDVSTVILDLCQEHNIELVAMTTHGRSGITRWIYGSVADRVLHHTHLPLLLVRSSEEQPPSGSVKNILIPLDGSPLAASVLPFVSEIAKGFDAQIYFFHAVPPVGAYPGIATEQIAVAQVLDDLQQQAKEYIASMVKDAQANGIKATGAVTIGFAVDEILNAAYSANCDLIALGTHGRAGIGRWVMGSVADAVLRRSHLPCLIVRPEEKELESSK